MLCKIEKLNAVRVAGWCTLEDGEAEAIASHVAAARVLQSALRRLRLRWARHNGDTTEAEPQRQARSGLLWSRRLRRIRETLKHGPESVHASSKLLGSRRLAFVASTLVRRMPSREALNPGPTTCPDESTHTQRLLQPTTSSERQSDTLLDPDTIPILSLSSSPGNVPQAKLKRRAAAPRPKSDVCSELGYMFAPPGLGHAYLAKPQRRLANAAQEPLEAVKASTVATGSCGAEGCAEREGSFPQYRWFYRQPHGGLWMPFSLAESSQIEEAMRSDSGSVGGRGVCLRGKPVQRFIQIDARRMHYTASGEKTEVLRGTWYYTRSDCLLQPYSEDVAERLSAAVQDANKTGRALAFDAGDERTITSAMGGGYLQRSAGGVHRLVTRLYVTPAVCSRSCVAHAQERAYALLKAAPLQSQGAEDPDSAVRADHGAGPAQALGALLPSVVTWWPPQAKREVLDLPHGTGEQWFYFRDDRTCMPYAAAQNSLLCQDTNAGGWVELLAEGLQGAGVEQDPRPSPGSNKGHMGLASAVQALPSVVTWWPSGRQQRYASPALAKNLRKPVVKYVVSKAEGWQVNVSTGTFRRVVSSKWFFQRSDGRLQPLPRSVDAAVQRMCDAGWDPKRTSLVVGADRVITAGVLGGLVQVRKESKRCRFVTNVFCQVVLLSALQGYFEYNDWTHCMTGIRDDGCSHTHTHTHAHTHTHTHTHSLTLTHSLSLTHTHTLKNTGNAVCSASELRASKVHGRGAVSGGASGVP